MCVSLLCYLLRRHSSCQPCAGARLFSRFSERETTLPSSGGGPSLPPHDRVPGCLSVPWIEIGTGVGVERRYSAKTWQMPLDQKGQSLHVLFCQGKRLCLSSAASV